MPGEAAWAWAKPQSSGRMKHSPPLSPGEHLSLVFLSMERSGLHISVPLHRPWRPVTDTLRAKGRCVSPKDAIWGPGSPSPGNWLRRNHWSCRYRIGPAEVENALAEHPAVAESAVVSSPDPIRGEVRNGTWRSSWLGVGLGRQVRGKLPGHTYPALDLGWREGMVDVHVHLHDVVSRGHCGLICDWNEADSECCCCCHLAVNQLLLGVGSFIPHRTQWIKDSFNTFMQRRKQRHKEVK